MSEEVAVDEDAKSRLEELQAEIRLETGQSVSQQGLLSRLIDDAYESREEVVDSFRKSTASLSEAAVAAFFEPTFDSGVETGEEGIDEILHGQEAGPDR